MLKPCKRARGEIEALPSGSLRVRAYAGIDPVTKRKHYLIETIPAGRTTKRFKRLADRLDLDSHIHALRHYSATELSA